MANKQVKNKIDGLIVLDKEKGYTSYDCLAVIKKLLSPEKIGHTGTLDVNATGVLVCLLGKGTKSQDYLMSCGDKIYKAELVLGISTDTEDITGTILNECEVNIGKEEVEVACKSFIGDYKQVPPMYSAKKVEGKKLINLARKGVVIDRKPANVKIYDIKVGDSHKCNDRPNYIAYDIEVSCSKGTYIRTLCKDIGEKLSIPSCMGDLRRIKTSLFTIDKAIKLSGMKDMISKKDLSFIRPCLYKEDDSVVTFGKFETLHLGHQEIINRVVNLSKEKELKSTVLSIGGSEENDIITVEQKISKLKYLGVDNVLDFPLNEYTMKMEAKDFVEEILINELKAKVIVVGDDCSFGYKGMGDKSLLKNVASSHGVEVLVIDKIKVSDIVKDTNTYKDIDISSTLIKDEYKKQNLEFINKLLGKTNE